MVEPKYKVGQQVWFSRLASGPPKNGVITEVRQHAENYVYQIVKSGNYFYRKPEEIIGLYTPPELRLQVGDKVKMCFTDTNKRLFGEVGKEVGEIIYLEEDENWEWWALVQFGGRTVELLMNHLIPANHEVIDG